MGRYRKPCTINSASNAATGAAAGSTFTITFDHDTSAGTYGNTLNVNREGNDADGTSYFRPVSTFRVMEIAT